MGPNEPSGRKPQLAASFQDPDVAAAYVHRPPYPAEAFDVLESLTSGGGPRRVLDLGAGEGSLARPLAERVDHVDAVEISPAMAAVGRSRPGGDRPNLSWHIEAAETMTVTGPYELVTAGASLHWMDWEPTLARVAGLLAPGAVLAIVEQSDRVEWRDALIEVIVRYSRDPDYDPAFSLPDELSRLGLLEVRGRHETAPVAFRQAVGHYVERFHSTASLARALMPPRDAAEFRAEVERVVAEHQDAGGELVVRTTATIVWGTPVSR
ncbi:class I SAM-dependent methyltransferase [Nonomuraea sp. NPDC050404]|uniref:class I SAM-dependent methyltransferase n=1 Tax=Nonomuraea sp. NPDC050404 TaxID=3155783 RepID=UPI0033E2A17B